VTLQPFDYLGPQTLIEALSVLEKHGDTARPIAGGQSVMPEGQPWQDVYEEAFRSILNPIEPLRAAE